MNRRLLLTILALALGIVVADRVVGARMLENGMYKGRPLPPFGRRAEPRLERWLENQLELIAARKPLGVFTSFHPAYGWTNRPGRSEGFSINSFGARGSKDYALLPAEGVTRVLCYGDSYTYGSEVQDGEDWPAQLEALSADIEALNFGVAGFGTDQALLRFRREGSKLGADAVVIGMHLWTIGRNVNRYRQLLFPLEGEVRVKPRFLLREGELQLLPLPLRTHADVVEALRRDELVALMSDQDYWAGDEPLIPGSTLARVLCAARAYERREPGRLWSDRQGEPFRVTLALLEAFYTEAIAAGAERAVVLITGFRGDLEHFRIAGEPYWSELLRALEERGIPYIDAAQAQAPVAEERELFLETHLNAEGNALVARLVHAWLD